MLASHGHEEIAKDVSSGRSGLFMEFGMQHKSHGVDTGPYLQMIDDTAAREENYLNASQAPGSRGNEDGAYFGRMRYERKILGANGYDHQGASSDQSAGVPDQATVRNMVCAYATKHGFHVGYNPNVKVGDEIEHSGEFHLPPPKDDETLSAPITERDKLGVEAHAFGVDGTQVYGYGMADSDAVDFLTQAHHTIGGDDLGFNRAGAAQFGWKGNRWLGTAYSQAMDGGTDDRLAVDEGEWMDSTMEDSEFVSTASQKHQMVTSDGFRNLNNERGSLAREINQLGYTKDGGYTGNSGGPSDMSSAL